MTLELSLRFAKAMADLAFNEECSDHVGLLASCRPRWCSTALPPCEAAFLGPVWKTRRLKSLRALVVTILPHLLYSISSSRCAKEWLVLLLLLPCPLPACPSFDHLDLRLPSHCQMPLSVNLVFVAGINSLTPIIDEHLWSWQSEAFLSSWLLIDWHQMALAPSSSSWLLASEVFLSSSAFGL